MVSPSLRDLRDEVVNLMRETTFSGLAIAKPFIDTFGLHAVALAKTSEPLISPSEIDGLESALITDFSMVASSSILARNQSSAANELSNSKYLCAFWPEQWHGDLSSVGKKAWSISYSLFLLLDNKLTQRNILHSLGSEKLKKLLDHHTALFGTEYIIPKISDFHRLSRQFDAFVVTAATSAGGSGIFLVKNIGTYAAAIDQIATPVVRIEKFNAQTVSLTQFGIVFEESVFLYEVQVQYVKELNHHLVYAGASWDTALPRAAIEEATSVSREVGLALSKMGYLGAFGCDLLFEQGTGEIHFMELNPRFVGETFLFSEVAASSGGLLDELADRVVCDPHFLHICATHKKRCPSALKAIMSEDGRIPVPTRTEAGFNTIVPLRFTTQADGRLESTRVPSRSCALFTGSIAVDPTVPTVLKSPVENLWKNLYAASLNLRMT